MHFLSKGIAIQENVAASQEQIQLMSSPVVYRSLPIKRTLAKNTPRTAMFASIAPRLLCF